MEINEIKVQHAFFMNSKVNLLSNNKISTNINA